LNEKIEFKNKPYLGNTSFLFTYYYYLSLQQVLQ